MISHALRSRPDASIQPSSAYRRDQQDVPDALLRRLSTLGYASLLALAGVLPFELTQRPWYPNSILSVTNLTVVLAPITFFALATLVYSLWRGLRPQPISRMAAVDNRWRRGAAAVLLALFLADCVADAVAARQLQGAMSWILYCLAGALICLAAPVWLAPAAEKRRLGIATAFVAGAVVAALVGFAEFYLGSRLEAHLTWFRPQATTMGPYLRLTSTFHHANEAAVYFCLALPFAIAGLARELGSGRRVLLTLWWVAAIDVLVVAELLTFSRGGLLALLAALVAMALATRRLWVRQFTAHLRGALLVAPGLVLLGGAFLASTSAIEALRLSGRNDLSWYQAGYSARVPAAWTAGQRRGLNVTVTNLGPLAWTPASAHDYGLSYHWLYPSWRIARFDGSIAWLRGRVKPGGHESTSITVQAPPHPGRYLLVWDILWHGTTWFGLRSGSFQPHTVRVSPGSGRPLLSPPAVKGGGASGLVELPLAQTADRLQLWRAAIKLIKRHPVQGLAANGFRWHYQEVTPPAHGQVPAPSSTHNLLLEITVDWGIPGAILFVVMLGVIWWSPLRALWRGRVPGWWEAAIVGSGAAFFAHTLVEYFLGTTALLLAFWLLCALALTAGTIAQRAS